MWMGAGTGVQGGLRRQSWQTPGVCPGMLRPAGRQREEIGPVPLRGFFAAWQRCPPGQPIHPSCRPSCSPPRQHRPRGWRRGAPPSSPARGAAGHCGASASHSGAGPGEPPARPAHPAPPGDGEETRAGHPWGQRPARLPPLSTATEPNRAQPSGTEPNRAAPGPAGPPGHRPFVCGGGEAGALRERSRRPAPCQVSLRESREPPRGRAGLGMEETGGDEGMKGEHPRAKPSRPHPAPRGWAKPPRAACGI